MAQYSVLLVYPPDEEDELKFYFAHTIEAFDTGRAVRRAQHEALYAQAAKDRLGLKASDFRLVMVLKGHHNPIFYNGGIS
jgi:hypothetical protein